MNKLKIFTDGGARGNPGPGAGAFVALDDKGGVIDRGGIFLGTTTNNQAEYNGVLLAFKFLQSVMRSGDVKDKPDAVEFFLDSELITNQLLGRYKIKDQKLQQLAVRIKTMEKELGIKINYSYVPRHMNKLADLMVNRTIDIGTGK